MALIKPGPMVSEARGTVGGSVFSRNRYGLYVRKWSKPTNPNTPAQIAARSNLGNCSQLWRGLQEIDRIRWIDYAAGTPVTNKLGEVVYLSGFQWFVAVVCFQAYAGVASPVTDPPESPGVIGPYDPEIDTVDIGAAGDGITFASPSLQDLLGVVGAHLVCDVSLPVSAGTSYYAGPWRRFATLNGALTPPPAQFGPGGTGLVPLAAGNLVFVRVRAIDQDNRLTTWSQNGPFVVINTTS